MKGLFSFRPITGLLLAVWFLCGGAAGASELEHWSFVKPIRHPVPRVNLPDWPRNEIDYFILARLEKEGLKTTEEADRYQLIRRVFLDLVGMPPSPAQADAFVADKSSRAFDRVVNDLLNSPRYGERWARMWLDLGRYADTQGYEKDESRSIWPYRDWVIRALNANMPYDRFTIEQIAGDILDGATEDQKVATGFHRNTMTNTEGGTDDEEFRDLAVRDRVNTTLQVWMGLTFGCAQCHDHKYDPVSLKEYYEVFAFFNQTADTDRSDDAPRLKVQGGSTLVMRELPEDKRRTSYVHERGSFLSRGSEVQAAVPAAFHRFPGGARSNRLGFSKWLVSRDNPLTARVTVNRYWARLFGKGIVETEEDFGTQGKAPTHPKLLDWLAVDFMESGWDVKALLKRMVLSATYRQSSRMTTESLERDPNNDLLGRGPRFRIEAETVRDQALASAGLLSTKMYGPSVMPPQPDKVWQVVYNGMQWETSQGEDRFRRGLYTFLRRTSPYPASLIFDAGSGEVCQVRRIRTTTPLQALVTLNDPVYMEAAQGLGKRALREGGGVLADRLTYAFRLAVVRPPQPKELKRLRQVYLEAIAHFRSDPDAAAEVLIKDYRQVVLPSAREKAAEWRYTSEQPASGWAATSFDDSKWSQGKSGFGTRETPNTQIGTEWKTSDIWLRKVIEVPDIKLFDVEVSVHHDEDFEIYFNGVLASKGSGYSTGYVSFNPADEAIATLKPGRNVVAVHCRQTSEGQYIDVGLTFLRAAPGVKPVELAAWTMVGNVLLNLDETLTKL